MSPRRRSGVAPDSDYKTSALRAGFPGPDQNTKFQDGDRRDACPTQTVIVPPEEVREKFKRVKPLKEISVKQRGWTLDVLNIVRRLVEARGVHAASSSKSPAMQKRTEVRAPSEFTTADAYAFTRELETLHPDNRHVRDNPVKNTGQESASNFKCYAMLNCYCTSSVFASLRRDKSAVSGVCHEIHFFNAKTPGRKDSESIFWRLGVKNKYPHALRRAGE